MVWPCIIGQAKHGDQELLMLEAKICERMLVIEPVISLV